MEFLYEKYSIERIELKEDNEKEKNNETFME